MGDFLPTKFDEERACAILQFPFFTQKELIRYLWQPFYAETLDFSIKKTRNFRQMQSTYADLLSADNANRTRAEEVEGGRIQKLKLNR